MSGARCPRESADIENEVSCVRGRLVEVVQAISHDERQRNHQLRRRLRHLIRQLDLCRELARAFSPIEPPKSTRNKTQVRFLNQKRGES